jgi:hypothetical protein
MLEQDTETAAAISVKVSVDTVPREVAFWLKLKDENTELFSCNWRTLSRNCLVVRKQNDRHTVLETEYFLTS